MEIVLQHDAVFRFNARYYTMGELSEQTRTIWWVMHGYGQLAAYFLQKFAFLDPLKNSFIRSARTFQILFERF